MRIDREKKLTKLYLPKKEGKNPIKRSMSGYEYELFVLNDKLEIDNSNNLLKLAKKKG